MALRLLLLALLVGIAAPAAWSQVIETERGFVEFVNLDSYTPRALLNTLRALDPDRPIAACAVTLRRQLGFADASVIGHWADDGRIYFVITVVEPADASRVRYRPIASNDTTGSMARWTRALATVGDPPLLHAAVRSYGHVLDGQPDSAKAAVETAGLTAEHVEPVWALLRAHATEADRDLALWVLTESTDYRSRAFAAALLVNFSGSDVVWWRLADALRDPDARVSNTATAALHTLVQHRPRVVDWRPALGSLRHILSGTNLFAYFHATDLLMKTRFPPALRDDLLVPEVQELLEAYLNAEHDATREKAEAFAAYLDGE